MVPLRVCMIAAELAPFAKTGGLADVVAALARHLGAAGHDVLPVMPLYGAMRGLPSSISVSGVATTRVARERRASS